MNTLNPKIIKAIIYDMDGLLIDSEPCWHIAEKIIFSKLGIQLSTEMCLETTGKAVENVFEYWFKKYPWPNPNFDKFKTDLFEEASIAFKNQSKLMPGALESLSLAKKKGVKIGLASASPISLIELALHKFDLMSTFEFYHSAILEEFNKPNPAVYLTVAKKLGIPIENCLILEDSGNGVKGAIASGAQVIAIPAPHEFDDKKFSLANATIRSLNELEALI